MSCIDHINVFGCFNCPEHDVCNKLLVPDDEQAMTSLKQQHNSWPIGFIGSFVSLLIHTHTNGHKSHVQVAIRSGHEIEWNVELLPSTTKLIILELASGQYTMTVANFDDNSIRHVDGRFDVERRGQRDIIEACVRNPQRLHTINQILASPRIHNSAEWTFICHPYLREINNAACGPILILAFYHEYFGEPLFGVGVVVYDEDLRRRLVEIHVQHFGQQDQSDNISPPESYRSNLNTMDERLDATPW